MVLSLEFDIFSRGTEKLHGVWGSGVKFRVDDEAVTISFDLGSVSEDDSQLMQGLFRGTIRTLAWKDR